MEVIEMTKKNQTMMRINKALLGELKQCKVYERESYADVIKRMIEKERKLK
jgi:predicted CopG family antitoxin